MLSLADFALIYSTFNKKVSGIVSSFKAFRALRLFKLVRRWEKMNDFLIKLRRGFE